MPGVCQWQQLGQPLFLLISLNSNNLFVHRKKQMGLSLWVWIGSEGWVCPTWEDEIGLLAQKISSFKGKDRSQAVLSFHGTQSLQKQTHLAFSSVTHAGERPTLHIQCQVSVAPGVCAWAHSAGEGMLLGTQERDGITMHCLQELTRYRLLFLCCMCLVLPPLPQ